MATHQDSFTLKQRNLCDRSHLARKRSISYDEQVALHSPLRGERRTYTNSKENKLGSFCPSRKLEPSKRYLESMNDEEFRLHFYCVREEATSYPR